MLDAAIQAVATMERWPTRYEPAARENWPRGDEPGWTENVNGVAHDDDHWYFVQNPSAAWIERRVVRRLWKFPVTRDLADDVLSGFDRPAISRSMAVGFPEELSRRGYDHFGDIEYEDGLLYVSIEGKRSDVPGGVAVFSTHDLEYQGYAPLDQGTGNQSCSWCAINPWNGLLYSSGSRLAAHGGVVHVYSRRMGSGAIGFERVGGLKLDAGRYSLGDIEGGTISRQGHLYLVSDTGRRRGGILGFDTLTGRLMTRIEVNYEKRDFWPDQELEGLTIWDLDSGIAPKIEGQIHLIRKDEWTWGTDELFFKHYRVPPSEVGFI